MYTGPLVEYQMGEWLQVDIMVEKATSLAWCPIGVDCPPDDRDCRKCWRDALCADARKRLGLGEEVASDGNAD